MGADDGFATASAVSISLAIGLVATASLVAAVQSLKLARADLSREQAEYALVGEHFRAAVDLLQTRGTARFSWTIPDERGIVQAIAEPETDKVALAKAADLPDETLRKLGAADVERVRTRLRALPLNSHEGWSRIQAADVSPVWSRCAQLAISPYGRAGASHVAPASPPTVVPGSINWRIGEVWRVRLTDDDGWTDDRIVRFTGDPRRPAAIVERRFFRSGVKGGTCDLAFK